MGLGRFTSFVVGLTLFLFVLDIRGLCQDSPDRAWRYPGYDLAGSNVYPHASAPIDEVSFEILTKRTKGGDNTRYILAGNMVGDNRMEICAALYHQLYIYNHELEVINKIDCDFETNLRVLEDIDGDGLLDIGVCKEEGNGTLMLFLNSEGDTLISLTDEGNYDTKYTQYCLLDNGDLIASVATGYNKSPRGVIRYERSTGNRKWFYERGPLGNIASVADIDDDGKLEISLISGAPENGGVGFGGPFGGTVTYDDCCYSLVIDEDGKEEYVVSESPKCNGRFLSRFVRFRSESPFKLVSWSEQSSPFRPLKTPRILLRDAKSGKLERVFYGKTGDLFNVLACDLNSDGVKEIIASNYDIMRFHQSGIDYLPKTYILDEHLNVIRYSREVPGIIVCANNMDGNGGMELVFQNESELIITDNELQTLKRFPLNQSITSNTIIVDANLDGYNEIYLSTEWALKSIRIDSDK